MAEEEVYDAIVRCSNCGKSATIMVSHGVAVRGHLRLKSEKCPNCNFRLSSNTL